MQTEAERKTNLVKANNVRSAVAALKRSAGMEILILAEAVRGWGRPKATAFLKRVGVRDNVKVERLTPDQRARIHKGIAEPDWRFGFGMA